MTTDLMMWLEADEDGPCEEREADEVAQERLDRAFDRAEDIFAHNLRAGALSAARKALDTMCNSVATAYVAGPPEEYARRRDIASRARRQLSAACDFDRSDVDAYRDGRRE